MTGHPNGPVVILGGGAVGSYVGGMLTAAGYPVVLVDGWADHVEAIGRRGLRIVAPEGEQLARPQAWHLGDAYRLRSCEPTAVFLAVKLHDTDWCARLLATWLAPHVPVVTLQNALVEEVVAGAVGWSRTIGAIAGGLDVALTGPAEVRRTRRRHASSTAVFKVGEVHGRQTPRVRHIAALLGVVDRTEVTTDLWTARWAKLCANTMTTGLSGLTGLSLKDVYSRNDTRVVAVALASEALAVGAALGFDLPALLGAPADVWRDAARGDAAALARAGDAMGAQAATMTDDGQSGTLQDLRKQRPTEVEFFNGFIAREGERLGAPAPTHSTVAAMIRAVERGERRISIDALAEIRTRMSAPDFRNPSTNPTRRR